MAMENGDTRSIRDILLVLSGKGGVGKSSVSAQLALCLADAGHRVGLLDIDLTGPSIPRILGLQNAQVLSSPVSKWLPVETPPTSPGKVPLKVMSLGFLLPNKDAPVIWRGPKKTAMIKQFVQDVAWGPLDYLIIDTPPGTSDEHITIVEFLSAFSPKAIMVTTPQAVSLSDVRKEISFCRKTGIDIVGLIENMSGFLCPHCSECTNVFSKGGGEATAKETGIPFLASLPIDSSLSTLMEEAVPFSQRFKASLLYPQFCSICEMLPLDAANK